MSEVTRLLTAISEGDAQASQDLLSHVYDELRRLARARMVGERADHTLQATALVHEAYLRLLGSAESTSWKSRGHFFAAAAEAMRRILIEHARRKNTQKRDGRLARVELSDVAVPIDPDLDTLLTLDEALDRLAVLDPRAVELVKLRYFVGLTLPESAEAMGISVRTAERAWTYARAFVHAELAKE